MKEIIEKLQTWKIDTDCDIASDWIEQSKRLEAIRQSSQIAMAIGLLSQIGNNNNIPK